MARPAGEGEEHLVEGGGAQRDVLGGHPDRVQGLQARGFKSPYLRNYVVARVNPVRFQRLKKGQTEPPMPIAQALTRMAAAAAKFDLASVSVNDVALVAAASSEPG